MAPADVAGRIAGRLFASEAYLSLAIALPLFLVARRRSPLSAGAEVLLVLFTLFCTVAGYFALLPMMAAARAGSSTLSFATLHALSAGFYALKTLAVLALAWRLNGAAPVVSRAPSS